MKKNVVYPHIARFVYFPQRGPPKEKDVGTPNYTTRRQKNKLKKAQQAAISIQRSYYNYIQNFPYINMPQNFNFSNQNSNEFLINQNPHENSPKMQNEHSVADNIPSETKNDTKEEQKGQKNDNEKTIDNIDEIFSFFDNDDMYSSFEFFSKDV